MWSRTADNVPCPVLRHSRCVCAHVLDRFTRDFYASKGITQEAAHDIPMDPYFMRRKAAEEKIQLKVPNDQRQRFLAFNRKVLRFYCLWDDRNSIYGERRPYVLHFYLEDDTVEVFSVSKNPMILFVLYLHFDYFFGLHDK